jgi:hypothetical protein
MSVDITEPVAKLKKPLALGRHLRACDPPAALCVRRESARPSSLTLEATARDGSLGRHPPLSARQHFAGDKVSRGPETGRDGRVSGRIQAH